MKKGGTDSSIECQKEAAAFFERFDRTETKEELHHAFAHFKSDWLLSTANNVDGTPRLPNGFIRDLKPFSTADELLLVLPYEIQECLSIVEFHQIARELVTGIYVFNQLPSLKFEPNHDGTSTCVLPSAYTNTLTGTALLSVGYYVESLIHGNTIPKEKHSKAIGSWRSMSAKTDPVDLLKDCGLVSMKEDPELGEGLYKDAEVFFPRNPQFGVDHTLANRDIPKRSTTEEIHSTRVKSHSREVFRDLLKQISLSLVLSPVSFKQHQKMLVVDVEWDIESDFASLSTPIESNKFSLLQQYLQRVRDFVKSRLQLKASICHEMDLLSFVCHLIPLLVTLKKQHRIIKKSKLFPGPGVDRLHTEKNIPPLVPSEDSRWTPPANYQYAHLNSSIQFYKQHWVVDSLSSEWESRYQTLLGQARESNAKEEDFVLKSCVSINDKQYCLLLFQVEEFYPKSPRLPAWVHAMQHELKTSATHLPFLTDARIQEYFYKALGPKKAYKIKGVNVALQASIEHGLTAPTTALLRRCTNARLNKLTEDNLAFIHYATVSGRDGIMGQLIGSGCDPNVRYQIPNCPEGQQGTPVHLAAQTGRPDTLLCLLTVGCSMTEFDDRGWAPMHYAAYHNNPSVIQFLLHCDPTCLDATTNDKLGLTPLLLSVTTGGLDTVKMLVKSGADILATSTKGENCVRLATFRCLIDILLFLKDLPAAKDMVWTTLKDMLEEDVRSGAVKAAALVLDPLTKCGPEQHTLVHDYELVQPLVKLLKENEDLQSLSSQVLRNISNFDTICEDMIKADAVSHVVRLLNSPHDSVQSCACILLCDLMMKDKQTEAADEGAVPLLKALLKSESNDVVLYACAALAILARDHRKNQVTIVEEDCLPSLVQLLNAAKPCITACAAHTLSIIVKGEKQNQVQAVNSRCKVPLCNLLKEPDFSVHTNAALAIECITNKNHSCQQYFFRDDVCISLLVRLLKMANIDVKIRSASALWAIASGSLADKRVIALKMDISCLVDTVGLGSEVLDYICGEALGALASEMGQHQETIFQVGGVTQLIHILRSYASERVNLCMLHCLATLLTKAALVPNAHIQKTVHNMNGIPLMVQIMNNHESDLVRAKSACVLAKLCLLSQDNQQVLKSDKDFDIRKVFAFTISTDPSVRLVGGEAISVFVYNNPAMLQQYLKLGRIDYACYDPLLVGSNEEQQGSAAFQITVLCKLLTGISSGQACVQGIKLLVHLAWSENEETRILCCEYLGRLAHSYDGLPQVIVGAGGVDVMITCLQCQNEPVMRGAATVLGYLSYSHIGRRLILTAFRDAPNLYPLFMDSLYHKKVCPVFLSMWKDAQRDGLPALNLQKYGGMPVGQSPRKMSSVIHSNSSTFAESKIFASFIKTSSQRMEATLSALNYVEETEQQRRLIKRRSAVVLVNTSSLLAGTGPLMKRKLQLPSLDDKKKLQRSSKTGKEPLVAR